MDAMKTDRDALGREAFEAYGRSTGGRTHDGREIPAWGALPERIREAWRCSAEAVAGEVLRALGQGVTGETPPPEQLHFPDTSKPRRCMKCGEAIRAAFVFLDGAPLHVSCYADTLAGR